MNGEPDLLTDVLKEVSRSFYLSLRMLPQGMREPAGVGYLLARISDTIADVGGMEEAQRMTLLESFRDQVCEGVKYESHESGDLAELKNDHELSAAERVLIGRTSDCLCTFEGLAKVQKEAVSKVIGIITEGQKWDLTRFQENKIVRLSDAEELERYTYQVAGCVGEFWTTIAELDNPSFSRVEESQMKVWAREYGRSLQLINILRDVPEDLARGRCYLPGEGVDQAELLETRAKWIEEARQGLLAAQRYCKALRKKRLRIASSLPYLIGEKTLDRLEKADWKNWQEGVKIPRKEVWKSLVRAMIH